MLHRLKDALWGAKEVAYIRGVEQELAQVKADRLVLLHQQGRINALLSANGTMQAELESSLNKMREHWHASASQTAVAIVTAE